MTVKERSEAIIREAGGVVNEALPELAASALRPAEAILGRARALFALLMVYSGADPEAVTRALEREGVMIHVSPEERRILSGLNPQPLDETRIYWSNESLWALCWILGQVPELPFTWRADEEAPPLTDEVALRSRQEVYEQLDLHYRLGWYAGDCLERYALCPFNFDVLMERLRALTWAMGTESWDDVDVRQRVR